MTATKTRRVPRAAIAPIARAIGAGLTAHLETVSASLRRSVALAAELESWAEGTADELPPSLRRFKDLHRAWGTGCGKCRRHDACTACVAERALNAEFFGLLENETAVASLMRIAVAGANPGERAESSLRDIAAGVVDKPLEDAIDEAVRASLARDRAKRRPPVTRGRT